MSADTTRLNHANASPNSRRVRILLAELVHQGRSETERDNITVQSAR
jgi:hypothetical protein